MNFRRQVESIASDSADAEDLDTNSIVPTATEQPIGVVVKRSRDTGVELQTPVRKRKRIQSLKASRLCYCVTIYIAVFWKIYSPQVMSD